MGSTERNQGTIPYTGKDTPRRLCLCLGSMLTATWSSQASPSSLYREALVCQCSLNILQVGRNLLLYPFNPRLLFTKDNGICV